MKKISYLLDFFQKQLLVGDVKRARSAESKYTQKHGYAKNLFYAFLLSWLFVQPVKADSDDSCTQTTSIMNAILDITTLGLFEAYSESFHMYGAGGYGGSSMDGENGCLADYYPGNCASGVSKSSTGACMHNSSYCQQDGTNCCPSALDANTGLPICNQDTCYIGVPCPSGSYAGECNPDGGLEFCYDNYNFTTLSYTCNGDDDAPLWVHNNYSTYYYWPTGQLRVVTDGDKICVQFWTTLGYQSIGCKYLPSCAQFYLDQNCYVAEACYSYAAQKSLALVPITGAIMQCINETIQYLFYGNPNCQVNGSNVGVEYVGESFSDFQVQMRGAVRSALMLYIILFGLKTVLGREHPSKGEFFRMGAKFILVMYFSVGIGVNVTEGDPVYDDGIHDYMLPLYVGGSAELADMVYSAGGSAGLCIYDQNLYPPGYGYLSMWDGIDCRLLYYFGINLAAVDVNAVVSISDLGTPTIFGLILPAFFAFQLIFLACTILFAIMFLSVTIYFVNISIISAILIAILIYMAPVFVPMALFEATYAYYGNWLKTTTAYALQPMIIAAYMAMMFTLFDQTMFGDCVFQEYSVTFEMGNQQKQGIPIFMLCDPHDSTGDCYECTNNSCPGYETTADTSNENITQCSQTIGYFLNPIQAGQTYTETVDAIFFDITVLTANVVNNMMTGLVTLCLFAYVFYKFGDVINEFAKELTGGSLGDSAGKPMALVDSATAAMKDWAKSSNQDKPPPDKPKPEDPEKKSRANSSTAETNDKKSSKAKSSTTDTKNNKDDKKSE